MMEFSTSTWNALEKLYIGSEDVALALGDVRVSRDQGRLLIWVGNLDAVIRLNKLLRTATDISSVGTYLSGLRMGVADLGWVRTKWPDVERTEIFIISHYLALQAARWPRRQKCGAWGDALELYRDFESLRLEARPDSHEEIVRSLYAIAIGGFQSIGQFDALELWYLESRNWPSDGCAVLTDVHSTESTLASDLYDIARHYISGDIGFDQLIRRGLSTRQSHNALFDRYFQCFAAGHDRLFRASGDGLAGFVNSAAQLLQAERSAASSVNFRLSSGIATRPVSGDRREDVRALDVGVRVTKLLKGDVDGCSALCLLDGALSGEAENLSAENLERGNLAGLAEHVSLGRRHAGDILDT